MYCKAFLRAVLYNTCHDVVDTRRRDIDTSISVSSAAKHKPSEQDASTDSFVCYTHCTWLVYVPGHVTWNQKQHWTNLPPVFQLHCRDDASDIKDVVLNMRNRTNTPNNPPLSSENSCSLAIFICSVNSIFCFEKIFSYFLYLQSCIVNCFASKSPQTSTNRVVVFLMLDSF